MKFVRNTIITFLFIAHIPLAQADSYHLAISSNLVSVDNKTATKIAINGSIPGPTLQFQEGEAVTIHVTNHLSEPTSIHWHGMLVPPSMDGVPGLNGFPGIAPGETFRYHFTVRQAGTYWYHAHSVGQEQDGLYGAIVIAPKEKPRFEVDRDYVVLLSEFTPESAEQILHNLKRHSSHYNYSQRTMKDFIADARANGFQEALANALDWGQMRMSPTDLADVSGYTFLINGQSPGENWTGVFSRGEKVLLRFINASAMSIYDVRVPGLKMTVVQADGQEVEPIVVDEFRFGVAETYDVIVEPKDERAYTLVAEPIDRSGFAVGTLAPREGMRGEFPKHRKRATLSMSDMALMPDMENMRSHAMEHMNDQSGWAQRGKPKGSKALRYSDLRFLGRQQDTRRAEREIVLRLNGNMERYIWTMNGKTHNEAEPIHVEYGERVKLTFVNESMMAHPMHLHGMFVQLDNGQPPEKMPNKHTIIIPPGRSRSVLLTANESGAWAFHCHLLYHMLSGMMTTLVVANEDGHHLHESELFDSIRIEADSGIDRHGSASSWDLDGWVGGDKHKLWIKAEGEIAEKKTEQSEFWALYSRNIAEFWDAQAGIRYDIDPRSRAYATAGFEGLAPYFFDSEFHLFLSDTAEVSARLREENDLLFTQRLIAQPYGELNFFAQDSENQAAGAGLSHLEFGIQTRYEITRSFAPYLDIRYEQKVGETSLIARQQGDDRGDVLASLGLRLGF